MLRSALGDFSHRAREQSDHDRCAERDLEGQHSTLLAGSIVANILRRLVNIELICAALLALALIAHPFVIDLGGSSQALASNRAAAVLRSLMFVGAAGIVVFDWLVVWPRLLKFRTEYIDHADEPEIANRGER